jgi:peptidyl-prolyl cis-trans isomerase C
VLRALIGDFVKKNTPSDADAKVRYDEFVQQIQQEKP